MALTRLNNRSLSAVTSYALDAADLPGGQIIKTTTYNPSNASAGVTGAYVDLQTISHTVDSNASKLFIIYTQWSNTHDGGWYNYGTHRVIAINSAGTTYDSQRVRSGFNTGGSHNVSDHLVPIAGHLYVPVVASSSVCTIKIQGYLSDTSNGSGTISGSETWVTVFDIK